jgi:predicted SnoaL-like aldol condensation-catalyzing enzyme
MDAVLERNKETAKAFYHMFFNEGEPAKAIELYAGTTYIQHNPLMPDGKQAFIDYFVMAGDMFPGKRVDFKRVIAEGDLVMMHCYQIWPGTGPGSGERAVVDIFRFDDSGKIVEHWDVLQLIPEQQAHGNTMF